MSRVYSDYLIDLLSPWAAEVRVRRMFGGYGLYRAQVMFGLIFDDALYFKVDHASCAEYEALGAAPFRYQAKGRWVTLSYWQVPADILEESEALAIWAEKAYQAALQKKRGWHRCIEHLCWLYGFKVLTINNKQAQQAA